MLYVPEFAEGVAHQIIERLLRQHRSAGGLGFQFVTRYIDLSLTQQTIHGGAQALATLAVFFGTILQDALGVMR
ncbi:hypothetical protein D3C84_1059850 [compost metagenome]